MDNEIVTTLVLKEDLAVENSREIQIERNFLPRKRKLLKIDNIVRTEDEFEEALTELLFPGHSGKPTFRQIISHNIRYTEWSQTNTIFTLGPYAKDVEYETLYLYLLGCEFNQGETKQELSSQIRLEESFKSRLEKNQTKSAYETALSILEEEIDLLNRRKSSFNIDENFEADIDRLNQIKYQINQASIEIGKLNIRRSLINEARHDFEQSASNIDLQQLELIYRQATDQIAGIQKTFQDLYEFHNRMIEEKVRFISKDLPKLDFEIGKKSEHLKRLLQQEVELTAIIARSDSFEELEKIITELNEKHQKKGEYESIIKQINEVDAELKSLNQQRDAIDEELFSNEFERKIKNQVKKFNRHFAAISMELYGEQYALKVDPTINKKGQRLYKFSAFNLNLSSGKKQGEISCFDIAYTLFADEENIPCLHFLLNDKKELMHDNQLLKIARLVDTKGIQFVASILKDKLPSELNREEYFVVKLSQGDKLFRIESNR
jgi:uncharacterized protein YydD (DUF2326 family)